MLWLYMLNSPAWLSLSPAERAVYLEVAKLYKGTNNGTLALSVREAAARCRINKDTAAKAFVRLQARGFIECVTPGGFSRKLPHATEYRLTTEQCHVSGAPASKAYMRWKTPADDKPVTRSQIKARSVPLSGTVTPFPNVKIA